MRVRQLNTRKLLSGLLVRSYGPMSKTRKWVSQYDGYENRGARRLIRALRRGGPDILFLGDSVNYAFVFDGDVRPVETMLRRELPGKQLLFVGNAGYFPSIWEAYLGLVEATDVRPVILGSLARRMALDTWRHHPAYSYEVEMAQLRQLSPANARVPRRPKVKPPLENFAAFRDLPCKTLLGEFPVGHYIAQIKCPDLSDAEKSKWWYAYLHGSEIVEGPHLDLYRQLGKTFARLDCPVIAYESPICVERGNELLGPEFGQLVEQNASLLRATLCDAAGPKATVLRTGNAFAIEEYNDPFDGVEHLNGAGRRRLAKMIADAIKNQPSDAETSS